MTLEGWPTVARHAMGVEPWTWLLGATNLCGGKFLLPIFFGGGENGERFLVGFLRFFVGTMFRRMFYLNLLGWCLDV